MKKTTFTILFMALLLGWMQVNAQKRQIKGLVVDESDHPLIGANVMVIRTKSGSVTNSAGQFSIQAGLHDTLVASYVGYKTQLVPLNGNSSVTIRLSQNVSKLNNLVVVGYGTQKKVNLTGAVENVQLDDIKDRAITNSSLILQGKVSGLTITQESGQPGEDGAEIRIRGVSSIDNNNEPLVIIDGVEGNFSDVNPNDIASMSVLKDASAAAIYGNRAAAGVIIITTKKGTDRLTLNYTGTVSFQQPTARPVGLNAAEYARLYNEARLNSGFPIGYDSAEIAKYETAADPEHTSTDWYAKYFSPAWMHNHYLNLRGGENGKYNFSVSGGYMDQQGVLYGTSNKKVNYLAKLNTFFFEKKLRLNMLVSGYDGNEKELISSTATVLQNVGYTRPTAFFKSTEGLYGFGAQYFAAKQAGGGTRIERANRKYQIELQFQPVKSLTASALYANSANDYNYIRLVPNFYTAGNVFDGAGNLQQSQLKRQFQKSFYRTFNARLNYDKQFGDHQLSALLGYEMIERGTDNSTAGIQNLLANKPVLVLGDPATAYVDGSDKELASLSFFGRLNYIFRNKYLFEANIRRDGSSRFTPGYRWGTFPSFSAGWRISEEPFLKDNQTISSLKLRGSWGRLGNANIYTYYAGSDMLSPDANYSFGGTVVPGTAITQLANVSTSWETTEQTNIGLDMTLFDRLDLTANYFYKYTYDILARVTIPPSLGVSATPYQNVGSMENRGVELSVQYSNSRQSKIRYTINVNASYIRNKVVDLGELDYINHSAVSGYSPPSGIIRSEVGHPFGSYYGYVAAGIYQVDDFTWQNNSDPSIPFYDRTFVLKKGEADPSGIMAKPMPGDIRFLDLHKDGVINDEDRKIIGSPLPRYVYSANVNLQYKHFEFNLLAQGVLDAQAYLMGSMVTPFWNGYGNVLKSVADSRWTPEHPSSTHERMYVDVQRANIVSTYYLNNASYLRIKNVELGYNFPVQLLFKNKIRSLKVFLSVENLLTITKFEKGFDPERTFNRITSDFHPQIRIFSFGTQLSF